MMYFIAAVNRLWQLSNVNLIVNELNAEILNNNLHTSLKVKCICIGNAEYGLEDLCASKGYEFLKVDLHVNCITLFKKIYSSDFFGGHVSQSKYWYLDKGEGPVNFILRNLIFFYGGKLIQCQHGESYSPHYIFSWNHGWVRVDSTFGRILNIFTKAKKNAAYFRYIIFATIAIWKLQKNIRLILLFLKRAFFCNIFLVDISFNLDRFNFMAVKFPKIKSLLCRSFLEYRNIESVESFAEPIYMNSDTCVVIYSTGAFKSNSKKAITRQIVAIVSISAAFAKYTDKVFVKLKPGEIPGVIKFSSSLPDIKFIDSISDLPVCRPALHILPCDSTACIEHYISSRPFLMYNIYEDLGYIGLNFNTKNSDNIYYPNINKSTLNSKLTHLFTQKYLSKIKHRVDILGGFERPAFCYRNRSH